jgi:hypothetical protein
MPTVLRTGPYRLFFYSGDGGEPPHVHVERDDKTATFWIGPVRLERSGGFTSAEIRRIQQVVEQHRDELVRSWNGYFADR